MHPEFDFQFGRRHHLRGQGYRGLVALGLVLIALVVIMMPARTATFLLMDSVWSALSWFFGI